MRLTALVALLLLAPALAGCASDKPAPGVATGVRDCSPARTNPVWKLDTTMGTICVELFMDKTPITAGNFVNLTKSGHFDGTKFHRVIKDFMNQGGDPLTKDDSKTSSWGTGGPGYDITDEFYCSDGTIDTVMNNPQYPGRPMRPGGPHQACDGKLGLKHDSAGVLSMANSGANTGGSQFFITAVPTPSLDGAHPVFGHTLDPASLDVVLAINKVETNGSPPKGQDRPLKPVVVVKATILGA